eukprot:CFRG7008T1
MHSGMSGENSSPPLSNARSTSRRNTDVVDRRVRSHSPVGNTIAMEGERCLPKSRDSSPLSHGKTKKPSQRRYEIPSSRTRQTVTSSSSISDKENTLKKEKKSKRSSNVSGNGRISADIELESHPSTCTQTNSQGRPGSLDNNESYANSIEKPARRKKKSVKEKDSNFVDVVNTLSPVVSKAKEKLSNSRSTKSSKNSSTSTTSVSTDTAEENAHVSVVPGSIGSTVKQKVSKKLKKPRPVATDTNAIILPSLSADDDTAGLQNGSSSTKRVSVGVIPLSQVQPCTSISTQIPAKAQIEPLGSTHVTVHTSSSVNSAPLISMPNANDTRKNCSRSDKTSMYSPQLRSDAMTSSLVSNGDDTDGVDVLHSSKKDRETSKSVSKELPMSIPKPVSPTKHGKQKEGISYYSVRERFGTCGSNNGQTGMLCDDGSVEDVVERTVERTSNAKQRHADDSGSHLQALIQENIGATLSAGKSDYSEQLRLPHSDDETLSCSTSQHGCASRRCSSSGGVTNDQTQASANASRGGRSMTYKQSKTGGPETSTSSHPRSQSQNTGTGISNSEQTKYQAPYQPPGRRRNNMVRAERIQQQQLHVQTKEDDICVGEESTLISNGAMARTCAVRDTDSSTGRPLGERDTIDMWTRDEKGLSVAALDVQLAHAISSTSENEGSMPTQKPPSRQSVIMNFINNAGLDDSVAFDIGSDGDDGCDDEVIDAYYSCGSSDKEQMSRLTSAVLELNGFTVDTTTEQLLDLLKKYQTGIDIRWVDDTHALAVMRSAEDANRLYEDRHNLEIGICLFKDATAASKRKFDRTRYYINKRGASNNGTGNGGDIHGNWGGSVGWGRPGSGPDLFRKERPVTSTAVASRLVGGALGIRVPRTEEQRQSDREKLGMEREKRRLAKEKRNLERERQRESASANISTNENRSTVTDEGGTESV